MTADWTALAAALKARRKALRYSQQGLADAAGVSRSTIQNLERETAVGIEHETMRRIETPLLWEQGSISNVLSGGDPLVIGNDRVVAEMAIGEQVGEYVRRESTQPDVVVVLENLIMDIIGAVAPDTTIAEVRKLQARALETLKEVGLYSPKKRQQTHKDDDPEI